MIRINLRDWLEKETISVLVIVNLCYDWIVGILTVLDYGYEHFLPTNNMKNTKIMNFEAFLERFSW